MVERLAEARRVEGIDLVTYVGKSLDLNRVGRLIGSYQSGMGCATHDVFDVPASAFHPFVLDRMPDTIASNADASIFRLYVPRGQRGQITDIGVINAVYKAPRHPWVSMSGTTPMYCAPADEEKYQARCAQTRPKKSDFKSWGDPTFRPGPGNRFHVTEID